LVAVACFLPGQGKDLPAPAHNYSDINFANYIKDFIQPSAVKVNTIWRRNYWGSSVWISTQQVNY